MGGLVGVVVVVGGTWREIHQSRMFVSHRFHVSCAADVSVFVTPPNQHPCEQLRIHPNEPARCGTTADDQARPSREAALSGGKDCDDALTNARGVADMPCETLG